MSDETKETSRLQKALDKTFETIISALVLGFFIMIWRGYSSIDEKLQGLEKRATGATTSVKAVTDTLAIEVAKLHAEVDKIHAIEHWISSVSTDLKKLRDYVQTAKVTGVSPPEIGVIQQPLMKSPAEAATQFAGEESRVKKSVADRIKD